MGRVCKWFPSFPPTHLVRRERRAAGRQDSHDGEPAPRLRSGKRRKYPARLVPTTSLESESPRPLSVYLSSRCGLPFWSLGGRPLVSGGEPSSLDCCCHSSTFRRCV